MDIVEIARTALSPEDFNDLETASKLYNSMRRGKHLNDWLALLPSLQKGRTLAMKEARTNQPIGRGYNTFFGKFLDQWFPKLNDKKMALSSVLWLGADPQRLAVLKELQNAPGADYSEVTSPITARQHVEKELKQRGVFKPKSRTQGRSPSTPTPSKHAESSIFKPSGVFISPQITPPQLATDYSVARKLAQQPVQHTPPPQPAAKAPERSPQPARQTKRDEPDREPSAEWFRRLTWAMVDLFFRDQAWVKKLSPMDARMLAFDLDLLWSNAEDLLALVDPSAAHDRPGTGTLTDWVRFNESLFDDLAWLRALNPEQARAVGYELRRVRASIERAEYVLREPERLRSHRQRLCYLIGHRAQRLHDLIAQRAAAL